MSIEALASRRTVAPLPANHRTPLGVLYRGDCLNVLSAVATESVDLIFADPPFNLGKSYASGMDDAISEVKYLDWCKAWIERRSVRGML